MLQIVGQLVLASRSLREAMHMLQRYHALLGNTVQLDLVEEGHLAYFVCTSLRPDPMTPTFDIEMVLSWVYRTSRRFAWRDGSDAEEVWLAYPAPPHAARYRKVFRCPVRFNRRHNAILFSRACLDKTQPYADWRMLDVLTTAAEQMLLEHRSPSLSDQVRALLRGETDLRAIDSSRIARMMRLTPRTFRRKLLAENTPWSVILDDTRCRIACDELRRTNQRSRGPPGICGAERLQPRFQALDG